MHQATIFTLLMSLSCAESVRAQATPSEVLRTSSNPEALERAASALARSADRRDLDQLGQFLRDSGFLQRLDPPGHPQTYHLRQVMAALAEHPSAQTADLCLMLAGDPVYLAGPDRTGILLDVLAKVKPMSERAAALFRHTNQEGYFASNAPLLAANGSPYARELFESMMLDKAVPVGRRIDCLHFGIVPRRTELPVLQAADRILSGATEPALANGLIESVFDYNPRWFGTLINSPEPPDWQSASRDSLRFATVLAEKALKRRELSPLLRSSVGKARATIAQALRR